MKKMSGWMKLFIVFDVLLVVVLVTRFVSVSVPEESLPKREVKCYEGEPAAYVFDDAGEPRCGTLAIINQRYNQTVKPIFEAKCLMCHGSPKELPLYCMIPPAKQLVSYDIKHCKHHMDMRYGFPFRADGTNKKNRHDLSEIGEVTRDGNMPPWYYKIMHWQSGLTEAEKTTILDWTKSSRELLKK